ncbi:putative serine protease family [Blattamonas nauphoetae]|uniref:Serine protease family n=1 Tax=Blattamonas nauphoetae TaxID=2049346 RepID=A0ABQ9XSS8_9EUKA|nr:putative serine protease family [Blattamonas nauphoetae]
MDDFTEAIIRPPRLEYALNDLGPAVGYINEKPVTRTDFDVVNDRNMTLKCSVFYPTEYELTSGTLPCCVYCHANAGCRLESFTILPSLLKHDICVVAFDFAGCGISQGDFISLGYNEIHDLDAVIDYIKHQYHFRKIVIWGRSMGASTALIYGAGHPDICGLILDTPFSRIQQIVNDVAREVKIPCSCCIIPLGKRKIRQNVLKLTGMDVNTFAPIDSASHCTVPLLLAHGRSDNLVAVAQSQELYNLYGSSDKKFMMLDGDHNDIRDDQFQNVCLTFIRRVCSTEGSHSTANAGMRADLSAENEEMDEVAEPHSETAPIFDRRNALSGDLSFGF